MFLTIIKILLIVPFTIVMSIICIVAMIVYKNNALFDYLVGFWYQGLLTLSGVKITVKGQENIPDSRSCIFVANHASYYDIPAAMIGIGTSRLRIVYKKELERIPVFGWAMKWTGMYIGINRGGGIEAQQSLDAAINRIKNGDSVLLFPEGTRTNDGKLQPFKRGAFNIATKAGVPIVPVVINGSYTVMSRNTFKITPGTITLTIEQSIIPPEESGKSSELEVMELVHQAIEEHYIEQ